MALKQLMLLKKIDQRKSALAELLKDEEALKLRSEEVEKALDEVKTEEEEKTVEAEIDKLDKDEQELNEKKSGIEREIKELEEELEQINSKDPKAEERAKTEEQREDNKKEVMLRMEKRKYFAGMQRAEIEALTKREDIKEFLVRVRELGTQKRSVTGADLLIPEVMLDLLRDTIAVSSKLITKVNYKPVKGKARQNITGTVPEAVWTEMTGVLNELEMSFNQIEVDGYEVAGFIPIPNSTLQDSDVNLFNEIFTALSKAIGKALDKAILFGLGTKQPLGFITRLAQTSEPSGYDADAPAWADLHTSNITKVNTTGTALIASIITAFSACKNDFADDNIFHCMNSVTYAYLMTALLTFNAAGALVAGINKQMPIIGGEIIILEFMNDYDIAGGYGMLYTLAEREGTYLASSEHVRFIKNQTVFKGVARYDGLPAIAKAFYLINIKNATAATTATFEKDYANTELGALGVTSVAGTASGDTLITVTGAESSGTTLGYKVGGKVAYVKCGDSNTGYTTFTTPNDITAATGKVITMVEFDGNGRAIKVGSAAIVAKA